MFQPAQHPAKWEVKVPKWPGPPQT